MRGSMALVTHQGKTQKVLVRSSLRPRLHLFIALEIVPGVAALVITHAPSRKVGPVLDARPLGAMVVDSAVDVAVSLLRVALFEIDGWRRAVGLFPGHGEALSFAVGGCLGRGGLSGPTVVHSIAVAIRPQMARSRLGCRHVTKDSRFLQGFFCCSWLFLGLANQVPPHSFPHVLAGIAGPEWTSVQSCPFRVS